MVKQSQTEPATHIVEGAQRTVFLCVCVCQDEAQKAGADTD